MIGEHIIEHCGQGNADSPLSIIVLRLRKGVSVRIHRREVSEFESATEKQFCFASDRCFPQRFYHYRHGETAIHLVDTNLRGVEIHQHLSIGLPLHIIEADPEHAVQRSVSRTEIAQKPAQRKCSAI